MKTNILPSDKSVALLLDPDKAKGKVLDRMIETAVSAGADYILTGGSLTFCDIAPLINHVRNKCSIPVILLPGNLLQLNTSVDGIYFISLISGRNPELLIGNHVVAAPHLKNIRDRVIPVGYILVNCGSKTSVEYLSQTEAIPSDKPDIIIATALAGEMLGMKMIYLEGGSGAKNPVPPEVIKAVKENITLPLVTGGGLKTAEQVKDAFDAGADLVILGNGCEKRPSLLKEACMVRDSFRKKK